MKNNESQIIPNRIYDKTTHQWFEVTADAYQAYDRERTAYRKNMQHCGRCYCQRSKWWLCDMMCMYCEFRSDSTISLDAPQGETEDMTLMDCIPDDNPAFEDVQADRDLLNHLIDRLQEIDPDADFLIVNWRKDQHVSDRALAEALGVKQRTFADRMKRVRTELWKIRSE